MGFDSELEDSGSDGERDVEGAVGGATGGPGNLGRQPGGVPLLSDPHDHLPIFEDQLLDGLQVLVQSINYQTIMYLPPHSIHVRLTPTTLYSCRDKYRR